MSAARRYAAVQNTTASKERMMVMLFETALRHVRNAIKHLEAKQHAAAAPLLDKAAQIVVEMGATLKPEAAPKLVADLMELYTFIAARLSKALVTGDVGPAREAERALAPIVDGFAQAVAAQTQAPAAEGAPTATPASGKR